MNVTLVGGPWDGEVIDIRPESKILRCADKSDDGWVLLEYQRSSVDRFEWDGVPVLPVPSTSK
jgi:hypothetical protein